MPSTKRLRSQKYCMVLDEQTHTMFKWKHCVCLWDLAGTHKIVKQKLSVVLDGHVAQNDYIETILFVVSGTHIIHSQNF